MDVATPPISSSAAPGPRPWRALLRTARPRQWLKNALVLAAPAAAGKLDEAATWPVLAAAFVAFTLAASGTYFVNDALDAESDRLHERKRHRPVAAGLLDVRGALLVAALLFAAAAAVGVLTTEWRFLAILGGYIGLMVAYSIWLRRVAVIDMAVVAAGFVMRAIAGGYAADVPISDWFLMVTTFGALFVVAGKRHSEHVRLGEERTGYRDTLAVSRSFFEHVLTISAAATIVGYALWAKETQGTAGGFPWFAVSVAPFVLLLLRYAHRVYAGEGGEPEEVILRDRGLQAISVAWALTLVAALYG